MSIYNIDLFLIDLIKMYYSNIKLVEPYGKGYLVVLDCGKKIFASERLSSDVVCDEYFTISKSSKMQNTICRADILKKIPSLVFEPKEFSDFDKLRKYIEINKSYPTIKQAELYNHIKVMCDSYHEKLLDGDEIKKYENLPNWKWDYSRLTTKGQKYLEVINKYEQKMKLEDADFKIIKSLNKQLKNKKISPFFEEKVRVLGLNIL